MVAIDENLFALFEALFPGYCYFSGAALIVPVYRVPPRLTGRHLGKRCGLAIAGCRRVPDLVGIARRGSSCTPSL